MKPTEQMKCDMKQETQSEQDRSDKRRTRHDHMTEPETLNRSLFEGMPICVSQCKNAPQ